MSSRIITPPNLTELFPLFFTFSTEEVHLQKTRDCIAMLRPTTQVCGNLREKTKILIKPLHHRYFSQPQFACLKSTIKTLEQGVKCVQS